MENVAKEKLRWVIANIFVNISSTEMGRKYISSEGIYLRFLQFINCKSEALRLAVLRILRNAVFEWENEEFTTELLQEKHKFIDSIAYHILIMIFKSELLNENNKEIVEELIKKYHPNMGTAGELTNILK